MCAMYITGPLPSTPVEAPNLNSLNLRLYQRITAQVLNVSGSEASLAIQGTPVVARMPSAELASDLLKQGSAQFIVTQLSDGGITLRLVRKDQQQIPGNALIQPRDLATRLLESLGLARSQETMQLVQAALKQGLLVTPETLSELETALQKLGSWGQEEADLAVALKALGLPVTAGSIQMLAGKSETIGSALVRLMQQLQNAAVRGNQPAEIQNLIQQSLQLLEKTVLKWNQPAIKLTEDVETLAKLLGRAFENELAEQIKNPEQPISRESLMVLGKLRQSLQQAGQSQLGNEVDGFLESLRQSHLMNVRSDNGSGRSNWVQLDFPLSIRHPNAEMLPAHIRISERENGHGGAIDPNYTRLVIQVELVPGEPMEVDLSFAGQQVQANITVPNAMVEQLAVTEWPGLQDGLNQLGYQVKTSHVDVGVPDLPGGLPQPMHKAVPFQSVDIEV